MTLETRLLAAHDKNDTSSLVDLYTEAANAASHQDASAFYLTQAYIYALDLGHRNSEHLRNRLVKLGREE
ncbi:hypothetical protein FEE96_12430 [Parasedimentitalea maritima]|uniref:Uncharacterized protein n=1 Tax=Parasedimentitalea maritima TaxID=2578117 RepID=A0ABY2UW35_9RHOB|nr:hypothetical protein FEE96_12430 [Zongyanglinia marina]